MPRRLRPAILSYDDLRQLATAFLREYHSTGTVPTPIEEIVEFRFRIDIIPVESLQAAHEVDGFISSDLKAIYVDEFVWRQRPGRYHFTLAHEVAHVVLHRGIYQAHRFETIEEWKRFQNEISEEDRRWIEWQAYAFAGLVLAPREPLQDLYRKAIRRAAIAGLSVEQAGEAALSYIAEWISRRLEVSAQVIEKRLRYDGLWPLPEDQA
jgi:hypothetical protein